MAHGAAREVLGFSLNLGAPVGSETDRRFVGLALDLHLTRFDIGLGGLIAVTVVGLALFRPRRQLPVPRDERVAYESTLNDEIVSRPLPRSARSR